MHEISLSGSEHWAMVKLARYHTRDHRAPTWGELYTDVLMMLVTEKRAIPVMKALQHKGAIVVHNNLVMFPQYYDTYYNEDFDKKYDFRNPETWIEKGEETPKDPDIWLCEQGEWAKNREKELGMKLEKFK